jgi:hypothetical protein
VYVHRLSSQFEAGTSAISTSGTTVHHVGVPWPFCDIGPYVGGAHLGAFSLLRRRNITGKNIQEHMGILVQAHGPGVKLTGIQFCWKHMYILLQEFCTNHSCRACIASNISWPGFSNTSK